MALINRISRLFRADLHAVLDRIEEPDILLRQAVHDMEDSLAQEEQHLKQLHQSVADNQQRVRELDEFLQQSAEELDLCLDSGKDELARSLLRRRLQNQKLKQLLLRKIDSSHKLVEQQAQRLQEHQLQLVGMRQKLDLFTAQNRKNNTELQQDKYVDELVVCDEEVDIALLREKQRRKPA